MDHVNWFGWSDWRWMLLLEGIPAVIFGVLSFLRLVDKPEQAKWLKPDEKAWLLAELERDKHSRKNVKRLTVMQAIGNSRALYLSFIYFVYRCGSLGVGWMPQIIKGFSDKLTHSQIGFIAMVPYIVATIAMVAWSRSSDRRGERKLHSAIPLAVAAVALLEAGLVASP